MTKEGETLLVQRGLRKTLQEKSAKPASMSDDWEEMDLKAVNTIQLCLINEVIYNVMDEEMTMGLWSRLEILYMIKSFSNKFFTLRSSYMGYA